MHLRVFRRWRKLLVDGKGYELRDYESETPFCTFREYSGERLPQNEWKDRIDYLNELKGQPVHWHKRYSGMILNQKSTNYCWQYSVIAGMKNAYARQGIGEVHLNAYATAYKGKRGANRGGYVLEGARYVQEFGVCEESVLPEFTKSYRWSRDQQANAAKHKLAEFEEFGRSDLDGVVSALIGPQPCAVAIALSWWRHAVCAVGAVLDRSRQIGLIIANSWGTKWSSGGEHNGYGIIWGSKAIPYEAIAIRHVTARKEA